MRTIFVAAGVIAAIGWGFMIRSGNTDRPAASAELTDGKERPPDLQTLAEQAFYRGEYDRAIELYATVVHQEPENAKAWARFAHAMHESKQYEPALGLHEKAATFEQNRVISFYRLSGALARLGREEESLAKLERAIEMGFRDRARAEREPDLASLQEDPRFHRLLNRMAPPPEGEGPLDFWQGHWILRNATDGEPFGHWSLNRVERGHLFLQQWHLYNGESGRGMLHLDPIEGHWNLLRVDNQGQIQHLRGTSLDGALTFNGELVRPTGKASPLEVVVRQESERGIMLTSRVSEDEGKSWTLFSEFKLNRDEPMWGGRGGPR